MKKTKRLSEREKRIALMSYQCGWIERKYDNRAGMPSKLDDVFLKYLNEDANESCAKAAESKTAKGRKGL